jgi:hypothetical protein
MQEALAATYDKIERFDRVGERVKMMEDMSCSRAELLKTADDLAERLHGASITTIKGVAETIVKDIGQLEERVDELEEMRSRPQRESYRVDPKVGITLGR